MIPLIIFDNIIYSLQKSGGISVYWSRLEDFIPVSSRFVYEHRNNNIFYKMHTNEHECHKKIIFERYRDIFVKEKKSFIFHSSYYRCSKNKNAINITTVHDFTYELFRHDIKSLFHKLQKKKAVMHSDGVICISENTKRDLYKYYPKFKGKVQVIYHGYDNKIFQFKGYTKRSNNVLFIGSRAIYKGFDFTIRLLASIPNLTLIIIGGGELSESENNLLNRMLPNRYKTIGFVSNEHLSELYNSSFALFYPSEYEGFGFPVIEAQSCGCPVICQKKSSIPEVSGDKCIYVDSRDIDKSVLEINKLFNYQYYSKIQKEGLENVKRFSWENCVENTQNFYEQCFSQKT